MACENEQIGQECIFLGNYFGLFKWSSSTPNALGPLQQRVGVLGVDELHLNSSVKFPKNMHSVPIDPFSQATAFPGWCGHPEYAHLHYPPYPTRPLLASRRTSAEGTIVCQDALNWSSRLRETRRASPLAHPTTSRPKPKAWVTCVACGPPPPHMGRYGPQIWHARPP